MKDKIRKYILDEEPYTGIAVMIIGLTFLLFIAGLYFYASVVDCDKDYTADKDKYGEITAALLRDIKNCPETEYVEETADMFITENALYDNRLILRCRLCGGEEFCIGAGTEITEDGLYVNPRVISGSDFEKHTYGIYAECSTNGLSYPEKLEEKREKTGETYVLLGRTYDNLGRGSELRWNHDTVAENSTFGNTEFRFRIVDLDMNRIAGTASCGLVWDGKSFCFTELINTDIGNETGFSKNQREAFITAAVSFLKDDKTGILRFSGTEHEYAIYKKYAVVQKTDRPYFKILTDSEGKYIKASTIYYLHPIAVSLFTEAGAVTVYLASYKEYVEGNVKEKESGKTRGNDSNGYFAFGYDLLNPESEDTLIVPPTFKEIADELQIKQLYRG